MRTEDPTRTPDDLLHLIWTRAGSPVRPAKLTDTADTLDALTQAAMEIRRELDIYIRRNIRLAAACHESRSCPCGNPLPPEGPARTRIYCSDTCRKQASRTRRRAGRETDTRPQLTVS